MKNEPISCAESTSIRAFKRALAFSIVQTAADHPLTLVEEAPINGLTTNPIERHND